MKQIWNGIQIAFSALGGFLGWFLGGADGFLYALIGDFGSVAISSRKISSIQLTFFYPSCLYRLLLS